MPEPSKAAATKAMDRDDLAVTSKDRLARMLWTVVLVTVFLAHYLLSLDATGPVVFEDELGYLALGK